jgi:hypothetical protein
MKSLKRQHPFRVLVAALLAFAQSREDVAAPPGAAKASCCIEQMVNPSLPLQQNTP